MENVEDKLKIKNNMAKYVDGFVFTVSKKNLPAYRRMAKKAGKLWRKYGALEYKECTLNEARPKYVTFTFPKMTKAKAGETVWFSYIVYRSKKHRNAVNAKVMKDPYMKSADPNMVNMPFDMKRMAYGGFRVVVDA